MLRTSDWQSVLLKYPTAIFSTMASAIALSAAGFGGGVAGLRGRGSLRLLAGALAGARAEALAGAAYDPLLERCGEL